MLFVIECGSGGIATTVVVTAVSAGFSYGIGTAATHINNFFVRASAQALAHGITQGGMTVLQGGKFWSGFAAGAVSSIMSSVWQGGQSEWQNPFTGEKHTYTAFKGLGNGFTNKTVGTMFFGTISGGAAAAVSGGNFWQGAVTGLIVSGLNHSLHDELDNGGGDPKPKKIKIINIKSDKYITDYTTVTTYDNKNIFGYLKNTISELTNISNKLGTVSDWTYCITTSKGVIDILKGIGKINPVAFVVGISASGNKSLIDTQIDFYNDVRDNYIKLNSTSNGLGIEMHHRTFAGPYGSHFDIYHAYDVKSGKSLGRLFQ
ncbi:hypothetical protein [Flavobacterium sp.]|uniref:hypothetical protein n=1 Tax=Flavobacterium sp. TaxID=239 RepID=UPI0037BE8F0F